MYNYPNRWIPFFIFSPTTAHWVALMCLDFEPDPTLWIKEEWLLFFSIFSLIWSALFTLFFFFLSNAYFMPLILCNLPWRWSINLILLYIAFEFEYCSRERNSSDHQLRPLNDDQWQRRCKVDLFLTLCLYN